MATLITAPPPIPNTLADNGPERLFNNRLMLIRVVLAVNDFILPASFSEKSLKGALYGEACRAVFLWREATLGKAAPCL
jgi:hypothetical protein